MIVVWFISMQCITIGWNISISNHPICCSLCFSAEFSVTDPVAKEKNVFRRGNWIRNVIWSVIGCIKAGIFIIPFKTMKSCIEIGSTATIFAYDRFSNCCFDEGALSQSEMTNQKSDQTSMTNIDGKSGLNSVRLRQNHQNIQYIHHTFD